MVEFDPDKWITLSEAAWIRGVKKQAMSQLAKRERFEPLKIGRHSFRIL